MKQRFRLYRRGRGGRFYIHDSDSGKQESLGTSDRALALRLLHSRNETQQEPAINLQIARAYLAVSDPEVSKRTWQGAMEELVKLKHGETQRRWLLAKKVKRGPWFASDSSNWSSSRAWRISPSAWARTSMA